ncbi:hypothetical protein [Spongiactinospora sp. TRM90649]|uniref:hypothetical protein n=1 Tax=Spongiactinospora sp. TRM90649 TaxID=3031114 RepID=UPI0023F67143|nr:hypothetical protein [Spongiactinospora sp. TRM90649]MDF5753423.1 hypothetical protein [Spongiactinospora sp. TRM90649]
MARLVRRVLVPGWIRRAAQSWFDARYVTRADHKDDIRDSLWEVKAVVRELAELRGEVEKLSARIARSAPDQTRMTRWDDAHRLAGETASAMDRILQNEVLLWQAVDRVEAACRDAGSTKGDREGAR